MVRPWIVCLVVLVGCGKKEEAKPGQDYGNACKPGVTLAEPWSQFSLPVADGRVCSSSSLETEVQYLDKNAEDLQKGYADALVAAGFTKEHCDESTKGITPNCTFTKPAPTAGKHEVRLSVRAKAGERQTQVWLKSEGIAFGAK